MTEGSLDVGLVTEVMIRAREVCCAHSAATTYSSLNQGGRVRQADHVHAGVVAQPPPFGAVRQGALLEDVECDLHSFGRAPGAGATPGSPLLFAALTGRPNPGNTAHGLARSQPFASDYSLGLLEITASASISIMASGRASAWTTTSVLAG